MCKFNIQCPITDGSCKCLAQIPQLHSPDHMDPHLLYALFGQQSKLLQDLYERNTYLLSCLDSIASHLAMSNMRKLTDGQTVPSDSVLNQKIIEFLIGIPKHYKFQLTVVGEIPLLFYKDRPFKIKGRITDPQGTPVALPTAMNFTIFLYNKGIPPERILLNNSGDKVLQGTLYSEATTDFEFNKVILKEVTSHFRKGAAMLVIVAQDSDEVKPLIIDNIVVKARKVKLEAERKKRKLEPQ